MRWQEKNGQDARLEAEAASLEDLVRAAPILEILKILFFSPGRAVSHDANFRAATHYQGQISALSTRSVYGTGRGFRSWGANRCVCFRN